jgi:hypothetical protein
MVPIKAADAVRVATPPDLPPDVGGGDLDVATLTAPEEIPHPKGWGFFWIFISDPIDKHSRVCYNGCGTLKYIKKLAFRSIIPHGESRVKVTLRVIM